METDNATQQLSQALQATLEKMSRDLNRVELLTAALTGFSRPVPDYEPAFLHLHNATLREHELGNEGA
jgi:hypothetical protein